MDLYPRRAAGAAHRLRRHRRRDRGDQRRRPRLLPAQAVGPAGGEALPGHRRPARGVGARSTTGRCPRRRSSGTAGRRARRQVREFLARNQVPYRWYTSDTPEGTRLLDAAGVDARTLPLVVTPDGDAAGRADRRRAGRRASACPRSRSKDFYDLIVIGGGPAGLGAAVYGASEGLRTVLVERDRHRRPGRPELPHRELPRLPRRRVRRAAHRAGPPAGGEVRRRADHHPRRRRRSRSTAPARTVRFADGASIDAHTVILATGVSVPAARRDRAATALTGRGVFYGSALTEAANCAEQDVYIVGGANSAGQAAVYLARGRAVGDDPRARRVAAASRCPTT